MKIKIQIKKNGNVYEKQLNNKIISSLFGLQFMLDEKTYKTLKLNKIDKDLEKFFKIVNEIMDYKDEGRAYKLEDKKFKPSKIKFYYSGKKPKWKGVK